MSVQGVSYRRLLKKYLKEISKNFLDSCFETSYDLKKKIFFNHIVGYLY